MRIESNRIVLARRADRIESSSLGVRIESSRCLSLISSVEVLSAEVMPRGATAEGGALWRCVAPRAVFSRTAEEEKPTRLVPLLGTTPSHYTITSRQQDIQFTTALARYYADVLNSVTISFRVLPPPYDSPAVPPPPPPRDGSAPASDARAESIFDSLQSDERYELTIDQVFKGRRVRSGASSVEF